MAQFRRIKKAATASATFAIALSIGYVMQYGDADASRFVDGDIIQQADVAPALDPSPLRVSLTFAQKTPAPAIQRVTDTQEDALRVAPSAVKLAALVVKPSAAQPTSSRSMVRAAVPAATGRACGLDVTATAAAKGMMTINVASPCRADMPFEVLHSGLAFSAMSDGDGNARVTIPALSVEASVLVRFAEGLSASASTTVPDAAALNRVVLQWQDLPTEMIQPASLQLIGEIKRYGTDIGTGARFAEVFSFPASATPQDALNDLTVKAMVSEDTCGHSVVGQTFHVFADAEPVQKDIRITLPDCENVGSFLELKKILGGQTLLPG